MRNRWDSRVPSWQHDGDDDHFWTFGMNSLLNEHERQKAERAKRAATPWEDVPAWERYLTYFFMVFAAIFVPIIFLGFCGFWGPVS
jgi:hypothetical protein